MSKWEVAAAGWGAAQLASSKLFFLVRWKGEGRRVPPSLVALWAIMLAEKQSFTQEIMLLRRCAALPLPEKPDAVSSLST